MGVAILDPFYRREPGRCTVIMVSCLNPVRFDRDDIPSIPRAERRSQFFLAYWVWTNIGTNIAEAQHIKSSMAFRY